MCVCVCVFTQIPHISKYLDAYSDTSPHFFEPE